MPYCRAAATAASKAAAYSGESIVRTAGPWGRAHPQMTETVQAKTNWKQADRMVFAVTSIRARICGASVLVMGEIARMRGPGETACLTWANNTFDTRMRCWHTSSMPVLALWIRHSSRSRLAWYVANLDIDRPSFGRRIHIAVRGSRLQVMQ